MNISGVAYNLRFLKVHGFGQHYTGVEIRGSARKERFLD